MSPTGFPSFLPGDSPYPLVKADVPLLRLTPLNDIKREKLFKVVQTAFEEEPTTPYKKFKIKK